MRPDNKVWTRF